VFVLSRIGLRLAGLARRLGHPLVSLAIALCGQQLLLNGGTRWWGGALLIAGAAAFGWSVRGAVLGGGAPTANASQPRRIARLAEIVTLLAVVAIAAAFRLYRLTDLPPGLAPEEASLGLAATASLSGGGGVSAWSGWPIFHWLTVLSIGQLGHSALGVRLPAAVGGILYVPALYLLGRQLGGPVFALTAALLGAVTFWHVDATRGAWGYIAWGLTLETAATALLLRALRERSATTAAFGGATLGLALQVSWGALACAVAVAAWLVQQRRRDASPATPLLGRAITVPFAIYFVLAITPVVIGLTVPDRAAAASTLAEGAPAENPPVSLLQAATRVLLMVNLAGDPNPLHNLAGEPMLDRVMAPLVIVGIAVAMLQFAGPRSSLLLVWLVGALVPAVLPSRMAGPDSLAAMHAITPILLLASLALTSIGRSRPTEAGHGARWYADLLVVLLIAIVAINGHTLFIRRASDQATWTAYASAEALAARLLRPQMANRAVYLADSWLDHPTIRFLVPELAAPRAIDPSGTVPFPQDGAIIYFAPGSHDMVPDDLEHVYSDGEIDHFRSPIDDSIVAVSFRAPADVIADARGVTLRVITPDRPRPARRTLGSYSLDWPLADDGPSAATLDIFAVTVAPTDGQYRLRLDGPPGAQLELNGSVLLGAGQEREVFLARGSQRLRVVTRVDGAAHIAVTWAPPGANALGPIPADRLYREQRSASGLLALYRPGTVSDGPAEVTQIERYLQRFDSPPRLARPYSVEWVGVLDAPRTGIYRFAIDASGPANLWIDDRPVVLDARSRDQTASTLIDEGNHKLRLSFVDATAPTRFNLLWAPPGDTLEAIPTERLTPPGGGASSLSPPADDSPGPLPPLGEARVRWLVDVDGEPRAVAAGADGRVYIAAGRGGQLRRVDPRGGDPTPIDGPSLMSVSDLDVGADGRIWALDATLGQIVRFEPSGGGTVIGGPDLGLYRPRGIGLAPDRTFYVADTGGSRVVHVSADGALLGSIGPDVGGPERIRQPTDVAVGPNGDLYVVNGEEGAVFHLTGDARYIAHWHVTSTDTERGPHLAIGEDGAIWVSEPDGRRLSRFTPDGTPAGVVSETRQGRVLRAPMGVAIGPDGTLYIGDISLKAVMAISTASP
jgi:sugar lactone lactonase YvrE